MRCGRGFDLCTLPSWGLQRTCLPCVLLTWTSYCSLEGMPVPLASPRLTPQHPTHRRWNCRWVPLMFGLAGVILGVSHPILDAWAAQRGGAAPRGGADPSWSWVLAGIACFVLQVGGGHGVARTGCQGPGSQLGSVSGGPAPFALHSLLAGTCTLPPVSLSCKSLLLPTNFVVPTCSMLPAGHWRARWTARAC